MDFVGNLLPELAEQILLYLDPEDIDIVWDGIEEWRHLFDNLFWKKVCRRYDYQENEYLTSNIYRKFMLESSLHWRAIYKYNRLLESNWTSNNFERIFIKPAQMYERIYYFDDDILVVKLCQETRDVYVDIINSSTGQRDFRFKEEKDIAGMVKHQNSLIYFVNKILKVFNLETKSWILNLKLEVSRIAHINEFHLEVCNNFLLVLNSSDVFYIVNLETKTINFKMLGVFEGCFGDNIVIVVLEGEEKIKTFDLNGKPLMDISYGGCSKVVDIKAIGGYVIIYYSEIAGQGFNKVSLYTVQHETNSLHEIRSINVVYRWWTLSNKYTVVFWGHKGTNTSTYMSWRFAAENHYVNFDSNENEMGRPVANKRYMFVYTEDCELHMWCVKTGKFIKDVTEDDMLKYFLDTFQPTEKKLVYINWESEICLKNYDFIP